MQPELHPQRRTLVQPFPSPGPAMQLAYRELQIAETGTDEQRKALGNKELPRPWVPATCAKPQLRAELWNWLDAVVVWINHELVFDPIDVIPPCWPQHAHLVHELAVLADLRRRADLATTSDALEEWHRYALPAFLERMRHRTSEHCTDGHPPAWPSAGRFNRHLDDDHTASRQSAFACDINNTRDLNSPSADGPHLRIVDDRTGEIVD